MSACLAARANILGPPPPTAIGGRGPDEDGGCLESLDLVELAVEIDRLARIRPSRIVSASSSRRMRTPGSRTGYPPCRTRPSSNPAPMPSSRRPFDRTSMVVASLARIAGWQAVGRTDVPRRMVLVAWLSAPRAASGPTWLPRWSGTAKVSKPYLLRFGRVGRTCVRRPLPYFLATGSESELAGHPLPCIDHQKLNRRYGTRSGANRPNARE